jgi:predicted HicB family RNase H-like nuclease
MDKPKRKAEVFVGKEFYAEKKNRPKSILIHLSKEVHRHLRIKAMDKNVSLQEMVRKLIEDSLK